MPKSTRKLDALAALLERTGGDPKRIEAVRRAQNFRRSWLDLAEILVEVRNRGLYEKWGYADLYAYAEDELTLKRATVDKLTISYNTLERHAPQVLERDGVATKIPSYDALEYYDRTLGELERDQVDEAANEAPRRGRVPQIPDPDLRREFEEAVFNEGQPVSELRRRFDSHFFPKPKGAEELELIKKASAAARKLAELLAEVDGLPETMVRKLEGDLGKLRTALDELAEPLREKVERATVKANKRALEARAAYAEKLVRGESNNMGDAADRHYEDHADEPARAKAPRKRKSAS